MSEINEDLIDDIGEVEADTDLTGADEDELLLSDDETFSCRLSQEQEEDLLAGIQLKKTPNSKPSKPNQSEAASVANDDAPQSSIPSQIDTNESIAASSTNADETEKQPCLSSESDLVTSTNRDDEETLSQTADCQSEQNCDKSNLDSPDKSAEPSDLNENNRIFSTVESSDSKFDQECVTSDGRVEEINFDNGVLDGDFDADDDDDVRERRNAKTCVERELPQPVEASNNQRHGNNKNFPNFQRNRNLRGPPPNAILPHPGPNHMGGDNFNPAFGPQFRGGPRRLPGPQQEFFRGHPMMMMRHPPGQMGRMPMMQPNRMPMPPHGMGPPRMQRGPFPPQPNMGFGNNAMPPQGMMRPRVPGPNPHPMMRGQSPPFPPFAQQNHSGNMRHPMRPNLPLPPHPQPMNMMPNQQPQPLMPVGAPRKVLINPNFKGGVQAATNQLMMDTMKNSQKMENDREAELLRQQEAFINQNRMHIEKRRRSREYSPERERSFSPPRRRERDNRKPHFRDNRQRRARSGERDFEPKRRRSDPDPSADKKDIKTDEDEETRAYRLEIEKQKAMREKILRDKEMRRRKAAEGTRKEEEKKTTPTTAAATAAAAAAAAATTTTTTSATTTTTTTTDESVQKLTPIIITEKKIISLKKKPIDASPDQAQSKLPMITRKSQASTAPKPAINRLADEPPSRGILTNRTIRMGADDDYDEDELLADSPPSTPLLRGKSNATDSNAISTTMFANRRVIVRNVNDAPKNDADRVAGNTKRIFNRLDKKIIGVNETAKQKIQRIVITNND